MSAKKKVAKKKTAAKKTAKANNTSIKIPLNPNLPQGAFISEFLDGGSLVETKGTATGRGSRSWARQVGTRTKLGELTSNVGNLPHPFTQSDGDMSAREVISLSRKAYYNISIYKSTIDIMTEFSNSKVHFKGGSAKARKFFDAWYKKINGWSLGDQFFREWYISGNVFIHKSDAEFNVNDLKTLNQIYGSSLTKANTSIPIRYTILDPASIKATGASFASGLYKKTFNAFEVENLKNPKTEEDRLYFDSLPPKVRAQIKRGTKNISVDLDPSEVYLIFCKKQDYEPFAIPLYFPVIYDLDLKLQFKQADKLVAKTIDHAILLITMGAKPEEGGVNQNLMEATQELMRKESVGGRVLIADYTMKAGFIIPDMGKIVGPEKYKVINDDIAAGLMNIFFGEDKFANSMIKIKVFLERLKESRNAYLNNFLIPEVKRISEQMGFKNFPVPVFEEVDLQDEVQYMKVYTRLAELGLLTPKETFEAFETNMLPTPEESLQNQESYKAQKEEGYYEPMIGGGNKEEGRPDGETAPQTTKNVGPIGTGSVEEKYSLESLKNTVAHANKIMKLVCLKHKEDMGLQRMSAKQRKIAEARAQRIFAHCEQEDWEDFARSGEEPPMNFDRSNRIAKIQTEHKITELPGILLAESVIKDDKE
ncbi:MAG: hypothetical protein DWQ49_09520 [Bacteroidetes bacterium]|nr:MAG: hypothetical protein DWQ49_09520 [Bacteroidota bacterium]